MYARVALIFLTILIAGCGDQDADCQIRVNKAHAISTLGSLGSVTREIDVLAADIDPQNLERMYRMTGDLAIVSMAFIRLQPSDLKGIEKSAILWVYDHREDIYATLEDFKVEFLKQSLEPLAKQIRDERGY